MPVTSQMNQGRTGRQRPNAMRWHGDWMEDVDERIMECLDESEKPLTPWMVADDLGAPTRRRVDERCRVLAQAGFVTLTQRVAVDDKFTITGWGRLYLAGEVDADLRRPLPAPKPPGKVRPGWYAGFVG